MHGGRAALKGVHHLEISCRIRRGALSRLPGFQHPSRANPALHQNAAGNETGRPPFGEPPGIIDFFEG
jgi:hypothetical protein